ncbi:MAG: hypothetical protein LPJ89_06110, partial [Hymenobacteraceae bacterium]|nr:hypothetical protein [Hymenobacteraceae bacterium]
RMVDFKRLKVFYADQGYGGQTMIDWVKRTFKAWGCRLEIVKKIHKKTFEPLPKRWIIERRLKIIFKNYSKMDFKKK